MTANAFVFSYIAMPHVPHEHAVAMRVGSVSQEPNSALLLFACECETYHVAIGGVHVLFRMSTCSCS